MIDLSNKGWACFGGRGSGKSTLVKHILASTKSHLVYDPMDEYGGFHRYTPTDRESVEECNKFVKAGIIKWKPALAVIDEANKYILPNNTRLPSAIADLVDFGRHWKISFGCVARRPVQFHTDIVELANFLFFFRLSGRNDYQYMEDLHVGLGDEVRRLKPYEFVILENGSKLTIHTALSMSEDRGRLVEVSNL